jgi:hypothetical protein
MISKCLVAGAALLVLPLLGACDRRPQAVDGMATVLTGHPIHDRDVAKLAIGRSTAGDVEHLLGAPDEHGGDGSLTYRSTAVRRSLGANGSGTADAAEVVGQRTVTFRFESGVLTRICRTRS